MQEPCPVPGPDGPRLVVFSDDWGRHASSSQHLVRNLLPAYQVDWVNTIGTRWPSFCRSDVRRGMQKVRDWLLRPLSESNHLRIHCPVMWPGFGGRFARRLNGELLARSLRRILPGPRPPVAVLTTVPLVADLVRRNRHLHWVYYCVDALADWPGLDRRTLVSMEAELLEHVDSVIVASEELRSHVRARGRDAEVLTHGIDLETWAASRAMRRPGRGRPVALFWGFLDRRLDTKTCHALADVCDLHLVGPRGDVDASLLEHPHVSWRGPVPFEELPAKAAEADVLVMPYAQLPVTRAMQPLKLKEFLATGKPVLVPPLPAIREWEDALDTCGDPGSFARMALERAGRPIPREQVEARKRLARERWGSKAERFQHLFRERTTGVLHVRIVSGSGSGPDKTILASARCFQGSDYRLQAAYLHDPRDALFPRLVARAAASTCPLLPVPDRHPCDLRTLRILAGLCRTHRVRIWHGHEYKSNLFGLVLRRRLGLHLVTTVHGWLPETVRTVAYHAVDRWCLRRYDRVLVVSRGLWRACIALGVPESRLRLVENGIDLQHWKRSAPPAAVPLRRAAPGRLVVGAVGRLSPEKGFGLLIQAMSRVLGSGVDAELWIAGEGPERESLERAAAASGRGARFRFLGHVEDLREVYERLDLFVCSSLTEALPNSVLESLAMEVPVLATRVGDVATMLDEGDAGLLCAPRSAEALEAGIRLLAADPQLRGRLASSGRRRVEVAYSFDRHIERTRSVYDELILGTPPRATFEEHAGAPTAATASR